MSNTSTLEVTATPSKTNITKRKLDEALHSLDEALRPAAGHESAAQSLPSKRARITRSIYSTLTKYGIKTKELASSSQVGAQDTTIFKSAPHLAAIIARKASRSRKAMSFKTPGVVQSSRTQSNSPSSVSEYRPSSIQSFLSRLATFKLSTYANKPSVIDAVAASKCGWTNEGKDRLVCGVCNNSWVVAGREGMSRDAGAWVQYDEDKSNSFLEKQRASLVDMHKDGCPWRMRQCDSTIYRIPLKPPASLAKEIKSRALELDLVLKGVEVSHPLTSMQVQALLSTLSTIQISHTTFELAGALPLHDDDASFFSTSDSSAPSGQPSETAVLTSLFGWELVPPSAPNSSRPRTPSLSRMSSVSPSTPQTPIASKSFTSSVSREGTPTPGPSRPGLRRPSAPRLSMALSSALFQKDKEHDTRVLQCALCQRRVGLWAFTGLAARAAAANNAHEGLSSISLAPKSTPASATPRAQPSRRFDLLKEHRSYCPYVVRSTAVPSLPTPIPPQPAQSPPPRNNSTSSLFNFGSPTPVRSSSSSSLFTFGSASASTTTLNANANLSEHMLEGWRAVLAVVSRSGLGRRQRERSNRSASLRRAASFLGEGHDAQSAETQEINDREGEPMELDGIEAMVEGVKASGGKDLLKYVRGLLG